MGLGAAGASLAVPLPSLALSQPVGCWWLCSCATVPLFERFPLPPCWRLLALALSRCYLRASFFFLLPGLSVGCAFGVGCWLLPLAPPFWIPSFDFQVWGVAVAGAWSPSGVFLGGGEQKVFVFLGGFSLVFFVKEGCYKSVKQKKRAVTYCFLKSILGVASAK